METDRFCPKMKKKGEKGGIRKGSEQIPFG